MSVLVTAARPVLSMSGEITQAVPSAPSDERKPLEHGLENNERLRDAPEVGQRPCRQAGER